MDIKEKGKKSIKVLPKITIKSGRISNTFIHTKETLENIYQSDDAEKFENRQINYITSKTIIRTSESAYHQGRKSLSISKQNLKNAKVKLKEFQIKRKRNKERGQIIKTEKLNIKTKPSIIYSSESTVKAIPKVNGKINKLKLKAKNIFSVIKKTTKNTITGIKLLVTTTKALFHFLVAGGFIVIMIILIFSFIGLLCGSVFGIFFSSDKGSGNQISMNTVVKQLNNEMSDQIQKIKNENIYDDYVVEVHRAEWKDILAIYSVYVSGGINQNDVITLDSKKVNILKRVFWDFHTISYEVKEEVADEDMTDKFENPKREIKRILYITISSKSIDEMKLFYHLNPIQLQQLEELLSMQYDSLWTSVIYGTELGGSNIVEVALSQVGNVGGEPYWRWYGFNSRMEWCAVFVSWVANQLGYIESNIIPKFSFCKDGVSWFKVRGEWKDKDYIPNSGDIIFFDWEMDGVVNHVGIVEKVENNKVYTIEGNSTDDGVRQKNYNIADSVIFGYGIPTY